MNQNKLNYIFEAFKQVYDLQGLPFEVNYGLDECSKVQVRNSGCSFTDMAAVSPEQVRWQEWRGRKIPFLFSREDCEIISEVDGNVIVNHDILAAAFYFLSGMQEYHCTNRDRFGRFRFSDSLQCQLGITVVPVVDYYFDILRTALERASGRRLKKRLWSEAAFTTCVTHDIDKCQRGWLEGGLAEARRGHFMTPFQLLYRKLSGKDVWFNFDEILSILQQHQARSTFFFLSKKGWQDGVLNADYNIANKGFAEVLARIRKSGSEVSIHGSFGTHENARRLRQDIHRIDAWVRGNRFHFLAFDVRKSPAVLEAASLTYDTTLGFSEHYGFRNGTCFPFYLYDIENDRPTGVLEIPLNLMDTTLHHADYLRVKPWQAVTAAEQVIQEIKKFGGCLTLLWHNTHFSEYKYPGWRQAFVDILTLCKEEGAEFLTGSEVATRFSPTGTQAPD